MVFLWVSFFFHGQFCTCSGGAPNSTCSSSHALIRQSTSRFQNIAEWLLLQPLVNAHNHRPVGCSYLLLVQMVSSSQSFFTAPPPQEGFWVSTSCQQQYLASYCWCVKSDLFFYETTWWHTICGCGHRVQSPNSHARILLEPPALMRMARVQTSSLIRSKKPTPLPFWKNSAFFGRSNKLKHSHITVVFGTVRGSNW